MPAGRITKPKAVNDLRGDSHKRRRHEKEPDPPKQKPVCPEYLDDIAKAEWATITDQLDQMGMLSSADRACIEFYCLSYSRYRKAEAVIAKFGEVLVSKKTGAMYNSPYAATLCGALDTCRRLLIEMGLTPAARSRLRGSTQQDAAPNEFISEFVLRSA